MLAILLSGERRSRRKKGRRPRERPPVIGKLVGLDRRQLGLFVGGQCPELHPAVTLDLRDAAVLHDRTRLDPVAEIGHTVDFGRRAVGLGLPFADWGLGIGGRGEQDDNEGNGANDLTHDRIPYFLRLSHTNLAPDKYCASPSWAVAKRRRRSLDA